MRIREPDPSGRRLTDQQRADLRSRIAAVPRTASPEHPAILALVDYVSSLDVPWWCHEAGGAIVLRFDPDRIGRGLWLLSRLCELDDWGADPSEWASVLIDTGPHDGRHVETSRDRLR